MPTAHHPFRSSFFLALLLTMVAVGGMGCAARPATAPDGTPKKLAVVATTTIHADLARQIGGDAAAVVSLLPAGIDPHDYEPTAADVETIAKANVIVINGLDLESWFGKLKANAGGNAQVIELGRRVKTRKSDGLAASRNDHGDDGHDHDADPHIWQSPANVKTMVENLRNGLTAADSSRSSVYSQRTRDYLRELDALDAWIKEQVATVPAERRRVVTNHAAFGYYLDAYGFTLVGSVLPSSGAAAEPSAQELAALITRIKEQNVPAIFTENTFNPKLSEQIARDTGVKVITTLYSDALGPAGSGADTYIGMLRANTQAIVEALR